MKRIEALLTLGLAAALAEPAAAQVAESLRGGTPDGGMAFSFVDPQADRRDERDYQRAMRSLDERRWNAAVQQFNGIPANDPRGDAALYWKAYALNKLGRRSEALGAIAQLQKTAPASRWLNDAKALEIEIRQASGQTVSPEAESDDDLKLIAINSLMNTDPERAIPALEKLLNSTNPPKYKERALFVLMQSGSPKAREVVTRIARGGSNPDLQMTAIQYLGLFGGKESRQTLADLYSSLSEPEAKRKVLQALFLGHDREKLLAVAKQEKNPDLRRDAIQNLGLAGGSNELAELYRSEPSPDLRKAIIQGLFLAHAADRLGDLARAEKDPDVRRDAISKMGLMGKSTAPALLAIYSSDPDKTIRKAVLQALFLQHNAPALIEIARKETDPELKRACVQQLSLVDSKESRDYMMELLK